MPAQTACDTQAPAPISSSMYVKNLRVLRKRSTLGLPKKTLYILDDLAPPPPTLFKLWKSLERMSVT
jgi:hypothetical protein